MLQHILPLIPKHSIYTEAFFAGGAVFFAKDPVESETINDMNNLVVNFYEVAKNDFHNLKSKVEATLFSRATYSVANVIYRMPNLFNSLQQAWAFYTACNMAFNNNVGSWGYDKYGKRLKAFKNKKMRFDLNLAERLKPVTVECNDACKVIITYDTIDAFHYLDPPYINTNCGTYKGYTQENYKELLDTLSKVKGKFLLSSFPTKILDEYIQKNNWNSIQITKTKTAVKATLGEPRVAKKTEVLTANYPISKNGL